MTGCSMRKLMWYACTLNSLISLLSFSILELLVSTALILFHYDQWSFGVTCWEVFSLGKNPYPGVDPFSLIRYLERGERLDKPLNEACSQEM